MQPCRQAPRFVVAVARQSCLHASLVTRAVWTHADFCTVQPTTQESALTVAAGARRPAATATSAPTTRSDFIVTPPRPLPLIASRWNVENRVKSGAEPWGKRVKGGATSGCRAPGHRPWRLDWRSASVEGRSHGGPLGPAGGDLRGAPRRGAGEHARPAWSGGGPCARAARDSVTRGPRGAR